MTQRERHALAKEIFVVACPDVSRETAGSVAQFAREA